MRVPRDRVEVLFDLSTVRHIDKWGRAANTEFKPIHIVNDHRPGMPFDDVTWRLYEGDREIARWRAPMPRFKDWLWHRLAQAHTAWHLAQEYLRGVPGKATAGKASGAERRKGSIAEKVRDCAAALTAREFDPYQNLPQIAKKGKTDVDYVRKVLKKPPA